MIHLLFHTFMSLWLLVFELLSLCPYCPPPCSNFYSFCLSVSSSMQPSLTSSELLRLALLVFLVFHMHTSYHTVPVINYSLSLSNFKLKDRAVLLQCGGKDNDRGRGHARKGLHIRFALKLFASRGKPWPWFCVDTEISRGSQLSSSPPLASPSTLAQTLTRLCPLWAL